MANININIRMDAELKKQFETFCADMGMSMSTVFTVFAKKVVRENRIPFEIGGETQGSKHPQVISNVQRAKDDPSSGIS